MSKEKAKQFLDSVHGENDIYSTDNVRQFRSIVQTMVETYARKNHDYGNSFAESLDEDGLLVSKIRLGDKFKRFSTLIKSEAMVNDESIEDTLMDLATYAVMTVMWIRDGGEKR